MSDRDRTEERIDLPLPRTFQDFIARYPQVDEAHQSVARAVDAAGPLDEKTRELVKVGISMGSQLVTATRSHVRRALQAGATRAEVEQAILLGLNTCGFPRTVAAWKWAREQMERDGIPE